MKQFLGWQVVVFCLMAVSSAASAQPEKAAIRIVASIKPLQLIAEALTHGVMPVQVLLPAGATSHDYALKPSDLKKVYAADVMLWLGPNTEPYLAKPMEGRTGHEVRVLHGNKEAKGLAGDKPHRHAGAAHLHGDPHVWFSPDEARRIATEVLALLVLKDPANVPRYQANLAGFEQRLEALDARIKNGFTGAYRVNYLVAHDAYSYFERHYGLAHAGVLSQSPEAKPGAKGLLALRKTIVREKVGCLFTEPQTDPRVVSILVEDNKLKQFVLDPMATNIAVSERAYETFLETTAHQFRQCFLVAGQ